MKRRPHKGEVTCTCTAYSFPHRMTGGKCTGRIVAVRAWRQRSRDCEVCRCHSHGECEVLEGVEELREGNCWTDFERQTEIRPTWK